MSPPAASAAEEALTKVPVGDCIPKNRFHNCQMACRLRVWVCRGTGLRNWVSGVWVQESFCQAKVWA